MCACKWWLWFGSGSSMNAGPAYLMQLRAFEQLEAKPVAKLSPWATLACSVSLQGVSFELSTPVVPGGMIKMGKWISRLFAGNASIGRLPWR